MPGDALLRKLKFDMARIFMQPNPMVGFENANPERRNTKRVINIQNIGQ